MKRTLASLIVLGFLNQPDAALSFTTSRPLASRTAVAVTPRQTTELNVKLPGFLSGNKEEETVTEMSMETSESADVEEELNETQKLLKRVKQAGTAGAISYALWELAFWGVSIPVCSLGFYDVAGHWPDLSNPDDMQKLGAEAFAFVNVARFAVPLRIGLALSTSGWIDEYVVQKFRKKDDGATNK